MCFILGPAVWADTFGYTICASEVRQSPVNLVDTAGVDPAFDELQFTEEWSSVVEGVFYNNGHTGNLE